MSSAKGPRMLIVTICMLMAGFSTAYAQQNDSVPDKEPTPPIANRFSYRTNVFEWLLTIPNVGIEFDLFNSEYNNQTIGLTAKYNWNTFHHLAPSSLFNFLDIRPEYRYYFRTKERTRPYKTKPSFKEWLDERVFTLERQNARPWRAYYIGAYTNFSTYSFKFSPRGIQGAAVGLGASFGYDLPRYQYKKCAIDIEFGFSVGLQLTQYDVFTYDPNGFHYTRLDEKSRGWHPTPFPVVSELKVAFVLRPESVEHKYLKNDPMIAEAKMNLGDINDAFSKDKGYIHKERFDEDNSYMMADYKADKNLYLKDFTNYVNENAEDLVRGITVNDAKLRKRLINRINSLKNKAILDFKSNMNSAGVKERAQAKEVKSKKEESKNKSSK